MYPRCLEILKDGNLLLEAHLEIWTMLVESDDSLE